MLDSHHMAKFSGYKEANIRKYSHGGQRAKFTIHPGKIVRLEKFRKLCHELVGKDDTILDNAGGSGVYTDIIREEGITEKIHAVDLSPSVLAERDSRDICAVGDMEQLPYDDGMFDRVLFLAAIHHVGDTRKALDEARRVLKPGGRVVLEEPVSLRMLLTGEGIRQTDDGVEFSFSLPYVLGHLRASGFKVERIRYQGFLNRFLSKAGVGARRLADRIEVGIDSIPGLRHLAGLLSDSAIIVARRDT